MKKMSFFYLLVISLIIVALTGISFASSGNDDWEEDILVVFPEDSDSQAGGMASAQGSDTGVSQAPGAAVGPGAGMASMYRGQFGPVDHHKAWMAAYLKLTPEQFAKLNDLKNSYLLDTRDLRYDMAIGHIEMMRLFTDPKASAAAIQAKIKQLQALRQKMMDRRIQMVLQARSILTPEQLTKLSLLPLKRGMMGGGMRGGMMGAGMGGGMMGGMGAGRTACQ